MKTYTKRQEWFLADPRTRKWIVQCAACGLYGRKPNTPDTIPKVDFEEVFPILDIDEQGLCPVCRNYAK